MGRRTRRRRRAAGGDPRSQHESAGSGARARAAGAARRYRMRARVGGGARDRAAAGPRGNVRDRPSGQADRSSAMTRVLLLGGTGDALKIARELGPSHVYSLAGLGKVPDDLCCAVRVGGFGGAQGMARYIESEGIGLVLDATHPYAARISANAVDACRTARVPCWALRRPP